jgi:hypothetical protein
MKLISHRGNLNGPNPKNENTIGAIESAIALGFDVEIDLWLTSDGDWKLGHDYGLVKVDISWLVDIRESLWIHCKNVGALEHLSRQPMELNFFWHDQDCFTLTSQGFVWAYPSKNLFPGFINVLPEKNQLEIDELRSKVKGVCTDFPYLFQN